MPDNTLPPAVSDDEIREMVERSLEKSRKEDDALPRVYEKDKGIVFPDSDDGF